jgi:DNA-binding NarL/FixJ family response regulator
VAIGCAATFSAGVRLKTELSLGIMAETVAAFLIAALATGAPTGALLGFPFAFAGLWSVSLTRREYLVRAQQAERTLAETRRARQAETQAAALAERASHPQTQVVVLTTYSDDESIIGALQAGALGYLTKDATRAEIGRAVLAAAAGQAVLDPEVQQRLLSAAVRAPAAPSAAGAADPADTDLTPRESEVLRLIAAGKSNREIARALFVSEATVKTHVNRIFAKTGSRDRTQAMRYAYTHGYADPP